jgi:Zn-dependent protease with chaperone function
MRRSLAFLLLLVCASGCALIPPTHPERAYYPSPQEPRSLTISYTLYRAAQASGDDPARYSFAFIQTTAVTAFAAEDATFYFSDGLARQTQRCIDAIVAQKVAHEILGHAGQRRTLTLGLTAGFAVLGLIAPGLGLADLIVNPLIVRAFTREQEMEADQRAIEILRDMGHASPRRSLAEALRTVATTKPVGSTPLWERGLLAPEPDLEDRLAALEPLEATPRLASRPAR